MTRRHNLLQVRWGINVSGSCECLQGVEKRPSEVRRHLWSSLVHALQSKRSFPYGVANEHHFGLILG